MQNILSIISNTWSSIWRHSSLQHSSLPLTIFSHFLLPVPWNALVDSHSEKSCKLGRVLKTFFQKQPSRGDFRKRCSENMQQICRRKPMPQCDFIKIALQLYWNRSSAWVFPGCSKSTPGRLLLFFSKPEFFPQYTV